MWLLEIDVKSGIPEREIGLSETGEILAKMPCKDNYGYWTDNNLLLEDFKVCFRATEISKWYFEEKWDLLRLEDLKLSEEHIYFEYYCRQLVGLEIQRVEYSEIKYGAGPYYPTKFPDLHSVDYSIFLYTSPSEKIEIYWDDTFFQFGVGVKINEPSQFSNYIVWDVSNVNVWKDAIRAKISSVKIHWETVKTTSQNGEKIESFIYPQGMTIDFANDEKIFVSAAGFLNPEDDIAYGHLDNLLVTNNEELARQVNMIASKEI